MKTQLKALSIAGAIISAALVPFFVTAAYTPAAVNFDPNYNLERNSGLGNANPQEVAANVIAWILSFLAILALILVIYGGFIWMLSRGNEEDVKKAKDILSGALFGLVIILASYGLTAYIFENVVNITAGE